MTLNPKILSMSGDSSIHISSQQLIQLTFPRIQYRRFLSRYLWPRIYFHILEALIGFFVSKKLMFVRHFSETTLTQRLSGSVSIFQPSFANRTALTSWIFLIPISPLTFWSTYFVPWYWGVAKCWEWYSELLL